MVQTKSLVDELAFRFQFGAGHGQIAISRRGTPFLHCGVRGHLGESLRQIIIGHIDNIELVSITSYLRRRGIVLALRTTQRQHTLPHEVLQPIQRT